MVLGLILPFPVFFVFFWFFFGGNGKLKDEMVTLIRGGGRTLIKRQVTEKLNKNTKTEDEHLELDALKAHAIKIGSYLF